MENDTKRLRKYQDDLNVSGTGVVLMGAWSIIRIFIELFMGTDNRIDFDADDPIEMLGRIIVTFIIVSLLSFIILKVHLYIGLNAIRASKGMPFKKGYLKMTVFFLLLSIAGLVTYWDELKDLNNIDTTIASMLVDLTTSYMFIMVINSTIKIRKLEQETKETVQE